MIAIHQSQELTDLVRLRLPTHLLQVEDLRESRVDEDVVASAGAPLLEASASASLHTSVNRTLRRSPRASRSRSRCLFTSRTLTASGDKAGLPRPVGADLANGHRSVTCWAAQPVTPRPHRRIQPTALSTTSRVHVGCCWSVSPPTAPLRSAGSRPTLHTVLRGTFRVDPEIDCGGCGWSSPKAPGR